MLSNGSVTKTSVETDVELVLFHIPFLIFILLITQKMVYVCQILYGRTIHGNEWLAWGKKIQVFWWTGNVNQCPHKPEFTNILKFKMDILARTIWFIICHEKKREIAQIFGIMTFAFNFPNKVKWIVNAK